MTAGPTNEYIDPVRVITNLSSGKTGVLLASELISAGAKGYIGIWSRRLQTTKRC